MKQFRKILKFELKNYLQSKSFVGITVFLALAIAVVMFFPRIAENFKKDKADSAPKDRETLLLVDQTEYAPLTEEAFAVAFGKYEVKKAQSVAVVEELITKGEAECAFVLESLTSYTYWVNNLSMYDTNTQVADEVLKELYRTVSMTNAGLSAEEVQNIMTAQIQSQVKTLGVDQMQNYWYTYIMIFALYMVILLYGQMVATNVATEKSSRAMEVLVTSADPVAMMFGKVLSSCLAGFTQLLVIFGTAMVSFNLNKGYWDAEGVITAMFDMPAELLIYMLLFFVLGFLIYAFMFGAVGSTASKLEDISTSVMPITMLFVVGFVVVMISMTANTVDTLLMKICSFVPFTAPMAMFTRIAMSTVPAHEIAISVGLLAASVVGVGILSAKIYRIGVLLYGTPPKFGAICKALRQA
ncbi:MAG: ABC transporter permease [Oscillospiraceae bacterium]|nr:ABC transporter permease [Oscillospiraceae bacterium]